MILRCVAKWKAGHDTGKCRAFLVLVISFVCLIPFKFVNFLLNRVLFMPSPNEGGVIVIVICILINRVDCDYK